MLLLAVPCMQRRHANCVADLSPDCFYAAAAALQGEPAWHGLHYGQFFQKVRQQRVMPSHAQPQLPSSCDVSALLLACMWEPLPCLVVQMQSGAIAAQPASLQQLTLEHIEHIRTHRTHHVLSC
jgi:hypothetical protein